MFPSFVVDKMTMQTQHRFWKLVHQNVLLKNGWNVLQGALLGGQRQVYQSSSASRWKTMVISIQQYIHKETFFRWPHPKQMVVWASCPQPTITRTSLDLTGRKRFQNSHNQILQWFSWLKQFVVLWKSLYCGTFLISWWSEECQGIMYANKPSTQRLTGRLAYFNQ